MESENGGLQSVCVEGGKGGGRRDSCLLLTLFNSPLLTFFGALYDG